MDGNSSSGEVKWTRASSSELPKKDAGPKYSRISERFRHVTPGVLQCSMFCGGNKCKYENPSRIKTDQMAINGLYSSWVTPDILATARPSTEVIKKYNVLQQFARSGIKSIINLQHPGEHASCGFGLEPESGFSYLPEDFMQEDIYFYNFGWNDYGVRSLESILDMVKVMSFALTNGKAAVHCHAGLGRTGVLIASYLVFSKRIEAEEAIHQVRSNRPRAIQTRAQIQCVIDFTNFLHYLWVVFPSCAPGAKRFTLQQYLKRQKHLLHGMEARNLKHIPKVVYVCCCRLLELAAVKSAESPLTMVLFCEVKAVFAEVDESDATKDSSAGEAVQPSISEDIISALKHNPYVDSSVQLLHTSSMQHAQSWDAVDEINDTQNIEHTGEGLLDLLNHPKKDIHERRASDSGFMYSCDARLVPSVCRMKLEPINLSNRTPNKKKQGRRKNQQSLDSESTVDATEGNKTAEKSFYNSLKQNASEQSTTEDRLRVAKCLASSACVDSSVNNRVQKIKRKLNSSDSWEEVSSDADPWILTRLLWAWLAELAEPVLTEKDVSLLEENIDDPIGAVRRLGRGERGTLECLITTICELEPLPQELSDRVLRHTAMVLTHNMELSLTQSRWTSERSDYTFSPTQSPRATTADGTEVPVTALCSPSYRLLHFLRLLMKTLKSLGGL
ncbi:protein tyrosine phosphatase domain-containing protein 1-like [Montipora capricornis]|uniref:protein tyrosine phosphatase domain-containing protein 1-like n=1 Tax=Montipora capricornis TaxID=246305 RepID=UPI0035F1069E